MGTYLHAYAEQKRNGKWFPVIRSGVASANDQPPSRIWDIQNYTMFGWLADVRNYAKVRPISKARGLPSDVSTEVANLATRFGDYHTHSWLGLGEILAFDFDATFEDRRTGNGSHQFGDTYPEGMGEVKLYRSIFSQVFCDDVEAMKRLDVPEDVRIVFWFD